MISLLRYVRFSGMYATYKEASRGGAHAMKLPGTDIYVNGKERSQYINAGSDTAKANVVKNLLARWEKKQRRKG